MKGETKVKKVNKIIALILAAIMMASLLVGCGGSKSSDHSAYRQKRLEWESRNPYNNIP